MFLAKSQHRCLHRLVEKSGLGECCSAPKTAGVWEVTSVEASTVTNAAEDRRSKVWVSEPSRTRT